MSTSTATGEIAGLANSTFADSRTLGRVLASSPDCQECIVKQMFRYAFGRPETPLGPDTVDCGAAASVPELRVQVQRTVDFARAIATIRRGAYRRCIVTRRRFLQGVSLAGAVVRVGLPPLAAMFTSNGTAYAAHGQGRCRPGSCSGSTATASPSGTGFRARPARDYELTPCLSPLASFRDDIHVISGLDNPAAPIPGPGNGHHKSMSGSCPAPPFTGRGAGGPSIDQVIAAKDRRQVALPLAADRRSQESYGESIHRNMSWAGYDRALPPEMIPHKLFDRLFGARDEGWVEPQEEHARRRARAISAICRRRSAKTIACASTSISRRFATSSAPSPACRRSTARTSESPRTTAT